LKFHPSFPVVDVTKTDFGGSNVISHGRSGPLIVNRHDQFVGASMIHYGELSHLEFILLEQLIPEGSNVIEVGANYGAHTVSIAKLVGPNGKVIAFEPQRMVYQALCGSMALNSLTNVWCHLAAVGESVGSIVVPPLDYDVINNIGGLSMKETGPGERVPLVKLDDVIDFEEVQLIKIDVEGMEEGVIRGAEQLIKRHRPALYVENDRIPQSESLIRLIQSMGYKLFWHLPPLLNPSNYFANDANIFNGMNYVSVNMVCIPKEIDIEMADLKEITDPTFHPMKPK
jgi:FkbM family methyltransferase